MMTGECNHLQVRKAACKWWESCEFKVPMQKGENLLWRTSANRQQITEHRSLWPTSVRLRVWPFNVITMTTSATTSPLLLLLLFLQLIKQLIIRKKQSNCHLDVVRSGAISCNLSQSQDIIILVDKCFSKGKGNKSRWLESHCLDSEKNTIDSTAKRTVCVPVSQMVMRE